MTPPPIERIAGDAPVGSADAVDADVIILTLHRSTDSRDAILSALAQTGVSRRVWVLDQGSTPEELAVLARCVLGRDDAALFRTPVNLGVPGGRNVLAGLGRGRVIAGLDNDATFADPTTLATMVAALDDDPGLAAIGCRIVTDATGADDVSSWGYPTTLLARAGERFPAVTFVGAGHAIRRQAWDEAGPYDAGLFFCWEEFDFCLRAIARGWRIAYRGDLVIRHRVSPDQRQVWSDRRWFHFVRNRLLIARRLGASRIGLLPRVLGYLVKGLRHGLAGPTLAAIAAAATAPTGPILALPPQARAYLRAHDLAHRGSPWTRWRQEVLGRLPDQPSLSRARTPMIAGLSHR